MANKQHNADIYARAIFQIAVERDEANRWTSDLEIITPIGDDVSLVDQLESSVLRQDDKTRILSQSLSSISPMALNLVYLLIRNRDLKLIGSIAEKYRQLINDHMGIETAEVTTAIPLDAEEKAKLEERLGDLVGKRVTANITVDPEMLGGFSARIGGKLIDGSTRSRLETLKKQIARTL